MRLRAFLKNNGGMHLSSFLIPLATVGGLIIGLGFSQANKSRHIDLAEMVKPIKSATAAPAAPAQNQVLSKAEPKNNGVNPQAAATKVSAAQNSIQRLKDYIKNSEEKTTFLKEKIGLLNDLLGSKEKELAKLNTDNLILKENLSKNTELQNDLKNDLQAKLDALNAQLIQKDNNIAELNNAKAGLENKITEAGAKFDSLSADYAALQSRSGTLDQDKSALDARLSKVREDLDRQEAINETLNKNITELTAGIAAKEKERLDTAKALGEASQAKKDMEIRIAQLETVKADNSATIKQLNSRIDELNVLYEEAKKSLVQMSNILAAKEQLIHEKESEISGLKESVAKSEASRSIVLASLEEKEKTISELNLALASMESRVAVLQKEVAAAKDEQAKTAQELSEALSFGNNLRAKLKSIYLELELIRAARVDS